MYIGWAGTDTYMGPSTRTMWLVLNTGQRRLLSIAPFTPGGLLYRTWYYYQVCALKHQYTTTTALTLNVACNVACCDGDVYLVSILLCQHDELALYVQGYEGSIRQSATNYYSKY